MTNSAQAVRRQCECVSCGECRGSGRVWFFFGGDYLGNSRCDDLDQMETCEECGGGGIIELCEYCQDDRDTQEELPW